MPTLALCLSESPVNTLNTRVVNGIGNIGMQIVWHVCCSSFFKNVIFSLTYLYLCTFAWGGGVALIIGVMLYSAPCGMQHAANQRYAYLLVRLHPNIGVPGTAVHWWSLLPDEVCHLYTPSRVPAQTHKQMRTLVLPVQEQET